MEFDGHNKAILDAMEDKIDLLQAAVDAVTTAVGDVETAVDDVELAVGDVETAVGNVQSVADDIKNTDLANLAANVAALDTGAEIWANATRKLTHWHYLKAVASNFVLQMQDLTLRTATVPEAYTKQGNGFYIYLHGIVRVTFDMKSSGAGKNAYGKIYKNGIAIGTERINNTTDMVTYSEDISVAPGDLIDLYVRMDAGNTNNVLTQNQKIYYDVQNLEVAL